MASLEGNQKSGRVKILGRMTSRGRLPVKPGKTYPLSPLDHAMAAHSLHMIFYYPPAAVRAGGMGREALKASLSETIVHFPAIAGRMTRPEAAGGNWVVKCTDTGVRVLDAHVAGDMEGWLKSVSPEMEKELATRETPGEDVFLWSPFTVQISEFECGGIAIGLSCAHMLADPTCATLIVKAWADCHRRACITHPPFFYPPALRSRPKPSSNPNPNNLSSVALLQSKSATVAPPPSAATTTTTFCFSHQSVDRCLAQIRASCPDASPFDALAALFWWRVKIAGGAAAAAAGPQSLTLCRDIRKLMYAPLPHGFFGNALHFSAVTADLAGDGWGAAAAAIRAHLAGFDEEDIWSTVDWLDSRADPVTKAYAEPFQMYGPELTCACLDGIFSYDVTWDADAAPRHVACHLGAAEGEGLILVLAAPPEEAGTMGRTVIISLPEDQTARICQDPVILELGPTLLFSST